MFNLENYVATELTRFENNAKNINMNALFVSIATPVCTRNCIKGLANAIQNLLQFHNIYDSFAPICRLILFFLIKIK